MLVADGIVLVYETWGEVNCKLETWCKTLEGEQFTVSRAEEKMMEFKLDN